MSTEAAAGAPSAEEKAHYEQLKKELLAALPQKRALDKKLAQIEAQIYALESAYFSETAVHGYGNILTGFDYLKNQTSVRRRHDVNETDRMFSNSSLTYQKSLEFVGESEDSSAAPEDTAKPLTPGVTTVVVPAATKKQEQTAAQTKRERDREYQRKKRANGSRRSTGTASDDEVVTTVRRGTKRARADDG